MRHTFRGLLIFAFGAVLVAVPSAPAADDFTLESLDGTYRFVFESTSDRNPFGGSGRITFDGNGGLSGVQRLVTTGGSIQQTFQGHYTVNPDGTGSMTTIINYRQSAMGPGEWPGITQTRVHIEFQIDPQTGEVTFSSINQTNRDVTATGRMRKWQ